MAFMFRFLTNYELCLLATRYVLSGLLLFYVLWPETGTAQPYLLLSFGYYLGTTLVLQALYQKTENRWDVWCWFIKIDLLVTSAMIYGSGGLSSDLYYFYFMTLAMAAYMYKWRRTFAYAGIANLCYWLTLLVSADATVTVRDVVMRVIFFATFPLVFPLYGMVDQLRQQSVADFSNMKQEKERLIQEMESISRQVAEYTFDLHDLAVTDQLTSLYNHTHLHSQLIIEVEKSKQTGKPLSLLLMDIDNFKRVNDTYGHLIGDEVLKTLALSLKELVRDTYFTPCRAGGEELAILMPDAEMDQAYLFADHVRYAISQLAIALPDGTSLSISVSVGVATFPVTCQNHQQLIDQADQAMYFAKTSGKNRTCVYSPPIEENTHAGL